jgi:hypothetical protein
MFDDLPQPFEALPPGAHETAIARLRQATAVARRRRRRSHRVAAVTGATVVFSLGFALLPQTPPDHVVPLLGLAVAVETLPQVSPPPGAQLHSTIHRRDLLEVPVGNDGKTVTMQVTSTLELWMASDGSIRAMTTIDPVPIVARDGDGGAGMTGSSVPQADPEVIEAMAASLLDRTPAPTSDLGLAGGYWPASEQELIQAMRRHVASSVSGESEEARMLSLAASLIRGNPSAPERRSRLLRVVAGIPGLEVETVGKGLEVSIAFIEQDVPLRLSYLLDGETGDVLAERLEMFDTAAGPLVMSLSEFTPWQVVVPGDPD